MKFALVGCGTRGDIEPFAALGRELLRRGHDVCMAVSPNMVGFAEAVGVGSVPYGPDTRRILAQIDFPGMVGMDFSDFAQNPFSVLTRGLERVAHTWEEKGATLTALASGADLLVAGIAEQGLAANVAEYHGIPLATLLIYPAELWHSQLGWLYSLATKEAVAAQRRALGLPESGPLTELASLEIQAYDKLCFPAVPGFPAVPAEWSEQGVRRPLVGALTLESPTDADDEVLSWIAEGSPPIYFGFGSLPVPAETIAMIGAACSQLGERALVCAGWSDFTHANPHADHVKIVGAVNHAAVFPACGAVVHHGGGGTTAAAMRAGIPTLIILHELADWPWWAAAVAHLGVGCVRLFSETTQESLIADLRAILTPHFAAKAREVAAQMTKPAESVARAADLVEETAKEPR